MPTAPTTFTPSELEALGQLAERRRALEDSERELDLRAALLDDAEEKIATRIVEFEPLRARLSTMIEQHDEAETAKLAPGQKSTRL